MANKENKWKSKHANVNDWNQSKAQDKAHKVTA
jgi:hypothetical protein